MTLIWAAVLGVVQGFAEFLPISSSAHLALMPWLFRIQDPVLASLQFDIALHAGSFIAILIALWPDWVDLAKGAVAREPAKLRFLGFLLVTSIPGAILGLVLEKQAETVFRGPLVVGVSIIVFGVLLWAVDRYVSGDEPMEGMTWLQAALIGVAQGLAIVPGVSRSGATITAGRALGLSREAIARYSFMAALPIIGGAAVVGLRKGADGPVVLRAVDRGLHRGGRRLGDRHALHAELGEDPVLRRVRRLPRRGGASRHRRVLLPRLGATMDSTRRAV
jgi:undecaprenyl-diphosphatase